MFKRIVVITIILGLFIFVNLFAGEEDDAGPWVQVSADDDITWNIIIYSNNPCIPDLTDGPNSGNKTYNAIDYEGCFAELKYNGDVVDSGTVPISNTGWLHLEVPFEVPDPDEPETH